MYLKAIYSGDEIRRIAVKPRGSDNCIIDVDLVKLRVFDIPEQDEDQDFYYLYQSSRHMTLR